MEFFKKFSPREESDLRKSDSMAAFERLVLFQTLTSLGDSYALSLTASAAKIAQELEPFASDWKIYNPAKPRYGREGLSVTSLDGGLGGVPDLTSLSEYNRVHGTALGEMSFRTLTPVYQASSELRGLLEPFVPYLGRTHFLKFRIGGFFPYHRDAYADKADTFRIFVPLFQGSQRDFFFLLGDRKLALDCGRAYFINTQIEHAVFSFDEPSLHLVINLQLCREAVDLVLGNLFSV